jgi:hypothetical protein
MKTHISYIAVILALLAAIWYLIDHNKAEQANRYGDNLRLQGVIESVRDEAAANLAASRDSVALVLTRSARDKEISDSLSASLLSEIRGHKRTIAILRPLVQPLIDANPDLSDLITEQDWTIAKLDSLNRLQELACAGQIADRDTVIRLQAGQITEALALAEAEKQRGDGEERAVKREKRGKKLWQWVAGIAAGVAVVVSLK